MIDCQACGAECTDGSRFCSVCGAALVVQRQRSERKVVTTLFCDLVGFTAHARARRPRGRRRPAAPLLRARPRGDRVLRRHRREVHRRRRGRRLRRARAARGRPRARGARRPAPRRRGRRDLPGIGGQAVEVRVGVNTGEALVRLDVDPASGEGFLTGDAVNVAARLQAPRRRWRSPSASSPTRSPRSVFAFEACHPVDAQGQGRAARAPGSPRRPWRAPASSCARSPPPSSAARTSSPTSQALLDEVAAGGARHASPSSSASPASARAACWPSSPAALDDRPELVTWRQGRCLPFGANVTFWALAEIVAAHAGILESDGVARSRGASSSACCPTSRDRDWLRRRLRPLLGLEAPEASREENFAAWRGSSRSLAATGPAGPRLRGPALGRRGLLASSLISMDHVPPTCRCSCSRRRGPSCSSGTPPSPRPARARHGCRSGISRGATSSTSSRCCWRKPDCRRISETMCVDAAAATPSTSRSSCASWPNRALMADRGRTSAPDLPETLEALIAARLDVLPPGCKAVLGDACGDGTRVLAWGAHRHGGLWPPRQSMMNCDAGRQGTGARPAGVVGGGRRGVRLPARSDTRRGLRSSCRGPSGRPSTPTSLPGSRGRPGTGVDEMAGVLAHHWVTALELSLATRDERLAEAALEPAITSLMRAGDCSFALDVKIAESRYRHALDLVCRRRPTAPSPACPLGAGVAGRWSDRRLAGRVRRGRSQD